MTEMKECQFSCNFYDVQHDPTNISHPEVNTRYEIRTFSHMGDSSLRRSLDPERFERIEFQTET